MASRDLGERTGPEPEQPSAGTGAGADPSGEDSDGFFELGAVKTTDLEQLVTRSQQRGDSSALSALSAFQRAADRFAPLSPDEQLAMVRRVRDINGELAAMAAKRRKDPRQETLLQREQQRCLEHVCASCWRLAWLIVREQAEERFGRDRATEMLPDLMSEANAALVAAVRDFDPAQTPKFATYAARVVRDHTRAVLSREGYMRLAPSWNRVKRIAATRLPELFAELGRRPTIEELQDDLLERCLEWAHNRLTPEQQRLPKAQRRKLAMAKLRKQGMLGAIRDVEEVLVISQSVISLDQPVGDSENSAVGDTVAARNDDERFDQVEMGELNQALMAALSGLPEREREIVLLRYGFDGSEGWTYSKIAERFGISSERVRQLERGALAKLSAPHAQFSALATFISDR